MTRQIYKTCLTALCLAALLAAMLLLAPRGLADGEAKDAIKIDGETVTLVSARLAGEKVSSLKVSFTVPEGTQFTFSTAFGETWLTYASVSGGVMTLYIAGTTPLMAEGQTELILGTVTNADQVQPVENSLGYVYGARVVNQTLEVAAAPLKLPEQLKALVEQAEAEFPEEDDRPDVLKAALEAAQKLLDEGSADEAALTAALQALQAALDGAQSGAGSTTDAHEALAALVETIRGKYGGFSPVKYTEDSWRSFNDAWDNAKALLADANASDEALRAAMAKLEAAELALETEGQAALKAAIQAAKDKLNDGNTYASASRTALEQLVQAAEELLKTGASEDDLKAKAAELAQKTKDLPRQQSGDPSGNAPGEDAGGGTDATAAPTAAAAATKKPDSAPNTGDETHLAVWAAVLCLSCLGLAAVCLRRRAER